jgi:hypothetical protein
MKTGNSEFILAGSNMGIFQIKKDGTITCHSENIHSGLRHEP